jgi:hypothetical protein
MPTKSAQLHPYLAQLHQLCVCNCKKLTVTSRNLSVTARYFSVTAFLSLVHRRRGGDAPSARGEEIDCNITSKTIKIIIYTQKSQGDFSVDLLSISVDFCGSSVDLLWIFGGSSVDFGSILGLGKYVIGLARFSEAGLWSNEVLFFGFFPFAIIFWWVSVDLESVEWIFESSRRHGLAQFTSIGTLFLPSIFGPKLKKEWPK